MISKKSRKQRKRLFNAPLHQQRKMMGAHLEEKLLLKYDKRAIPVIKGDTVKVMRGIYKGHEDKVARVNVKKRIVEIEGLTLIKADGKKIPKPMPPSNVMITKLNLTDKWRRHTLERGLTEDIKKEIEKEAENQVHDQEIEQKKAEEEAKHQAELEEKEEHSEEPELPEEPITGEAEPEQKSTPKPKTEKPVELKEKTTPLKLPEKKIEEKKQTKVPVKKPAPKKTEKKPKQTPTKTKKEEIK